MICTGCSCTRGEDDGITGFVGGVETERTCLGWAGWSTGQGMVDRRRAWRGSRTEAGSRPRRGRRSTAASREAEAPRRALGPWSRLASAEN